MSMEIIKAGALTTVQDGGRKGYAAQGFQENGACDQYNYRIASLLAGNECLPPFPAALEMTLMGAEIRFDTHEIIALAGADMKPMLDGEPVAMYRPILIRPGSVLTLGLATVGLRSYLAIYGGFDVPEVMGSRSTSLRCGLGGLEGRALKTGDRLESRASAKAVRRIWKCMDGNTALWADEAERAPLPSSGAGVDELGEYPVLRAVAGPQQEAFTEKGIADFEAGVFSLSEQSDRMACRLKGRKLEICHGSDIISDGIVAGSVQVSSDGTPIIMMADHQTTGGYAKIATVISADLPRLAQLKPGERVGFRLVTVEAAVQAAREAAGRLAGLEERLRSLKAEPGC